MTRGPLRRALLLLALLLGAGSLEAQPARPWYEAYEAGLLALRAKRAGDAIAAFEHAARLQPAPGRNVQTYGTNFLDDYQPYLKLAEACLLVEDAAAARLALDRGARYPGESSAGRARLLQQIEALESRRAPAERAPAASPTPPPRSTESPTATASPPPAALHTPAASPSAWSPYAGATPAVATPPASTKAHPSPSLPPPAALAVRSPAPPTTQRAALPAFALRTSPPGATVYLDDTLIGTTDPATGRLRIPGVEPGQHRLRLSRPGYADLVRDVEVVGGSLPLEVDLAPLPAVATAPAAVPPAAAVSERTSTGLLSVGAVIALALAYAWFRQRRTRPDGSLTWTFALPGMPSRPPSGRTPAPAADTPGRTPGGSQRTPRPFDADELFPIPFGEYTLLSKLGRGGMAVVYEAERDGDRVALKRPLPGFQEDPRFLERFLREAEIGRTLHHPNVIHIQDGGEIDGVPFFTMDLIAGETLAARLRREGALGVDEALRITIAVAEALDYGHSKGVVHRDLKPSNVLLAESGAIKVSDYGIARARRFEGLTATGAFLGSPDYAAPEMIEGRTLDARADLYALGVILYEMLAGRRPFEADAPFAVLRLHVSEPPRPLREIAAHVPLALEAEVMRLLAKDPAERHADAEELLLKLRALE